MTFVSDDKLRCTNFKYEELDNRKVFKSETIDDFSNFDEWLHLVRIEILATFPFLF